MNAVPKTYDRRSDDPIISAMFDALRDGSERMAKIEADVAQLSQTIEPLRGIATAMKWMVFASKVFGLLLVALISIVGWVADQKSRDIYDLQKLMQTQVSQTAEMIVVVKQNQKDNQVQDQKIDDLIKKVK